MNILFEVICENSWPKHLTIGSTFWEVEDDNLYLIFY